MHISYYYCAKAKTNVLSSILPCLVLNLKGNRVFDEGKASTPTLTGEFKWPFKFLRFLALNAKGGETIRPKAKGPHHPHFTNSKCQSAFHLVSKIQLV
jgi:hypothetical protein